MFFKVQQGLEVTEPLGQMQLCLNSCVEPSIGGILRHAALLTCCVMIVLSAGIVFAECSSG